VGVTVAAGLALASLAAFHTVYATHEAYMFSAHGWPLMVGVGLAWVARSGGAARWLATASVAVATCGTAWVMMGLVAG
jgi:hypothetical protein